MVNRYSNFPSQIDKLKTLPEFQEISVKQWKSFSKWNELISKGSNMTENDINELNRLLKSDLRDVQITSTDWNKLCDSVTNLEDYIINHIFPDISKMINEKEKEFTTIVTKKTQEFNIKIDNFVDKGIYNNDTHYNKNNFIHYDDGTGLKIYIALKDTQGVSPSDDGIVWRLLTIKGDKGDNGQDGLNLVFKGGWNPSTNYKFGQVTSYNGSVFVSMQDDNLNNIPNENIDTEYWAKWKQVSITTTKLKGIRKVINPTNKIKFIGCGDITVFNPHIDDLEVCKNNLILVENLQYKINEDNQTIDSLEGDWNASADSPNIFEFRVVRNQINNLTFSDGQTIQDKTITKNKLSTDVQNEINSIKTLNEEVENLKSHVDNGKSSLYSAIVGKKATPRSKDFSDLVEGIKNIKLGQGTAQASEVLEGRTFTNDSGVMQTGTMPNMGSKEIEPKIYSQELGKGYYEKVKLKGINDLDNYTMKEVVKTIAPKIKDDLPSIIQSAGILPFKTWSWKGDSYYGNPLNKDVPYKSMKVPFEIKILFTKCDGYQGGGADGVITQTWVDKDFFKTTIGEHFIFIPQDLVHYGMAAQNNFNYIDDTPYHYYFSEFKIAEDKQTINFPNGNATNIEIYALGW